MFRKALAASTIAVAALAFSGCAAQGGPAEAPEEDSYPTDDITFIVPYPAGSAPDAGARLIGAQLEDELGVSVVIENREGGASTIGLFELASHEADGYTIGLASFSGLSLQSRLIDNPFEGIETLTPIAQTKLPAFLLFTSPEQGWDSIDDFIEDAKSRPGEITVGVPNQNSVPDVLVKLLEKSADIDLTPVYFDAGQQVLPVVNGTADVGIAQAGPVSQFVTAGDLEWIGAFGSNVPEGLDVPLFEDGGYDTSTISDYEGVFGPAGLPENVIEKLAAAIEKAVASDEFQEFMSTTYSTGSFLGGAVFDERAHELDAAAEDLIKRLKLG